MRLQTLKICWQALTNLTELKLSDQILVFFGSLNQGDMNHPQITFTPPGHRDALMANTNVSAKVQKACKIALCNLVTVLLKREVNELDFGSTCYGKPYLKNEKKLSFNVSHTNSSFLIALGSTGRIGIDHEPVSKNFLKDDIMAYAFSEHEINYCKKDGQVSSFFEIWTLKEALLKALGTGLSIDLKRVSVAGVFPDSIDRAGLSRLMFYSPEGELAHLVYRGNPSRIVFYWIK